MISGVMFNGGRAMEAVGDEAGSHERMRRELVALSTLIAGSRARRTTQGPVENARAMLRPDLVEIRLSGISAREVEFRSRVRSRTGLPTRSSIGSSARGPLGP
jgi:hypothetical protein